MSDLENLRDLNSEDNPLNFRLCKGIYIEPETIAYTDYQEIRESYLRILETMFKNNMYVGIASHDKYLIDHAFALIEKYGVPANRHEFQMLYGVTPELRQSVVDNGHRMRVYVHFGKHWFNYSTRRLKENPKRANHIIKDLFIKG